MNNSTVTLFPDVFARTAREVPLSALLDLLRDPPIRPSKKACELFVAAKLGDHRTDKDSLRNDENVLEVSAIVGDYDGERVAIDTARERLEVLGVQATLCASPSYTAEKPRWRVVAPLSAPQPKEAHPRLAARLNAALGGILAPESFTLSQSYYFGRINGHEYIHAASAGRCLDLCNELDDLIPPEVAPAGAAKASADTDAQLRGDILGGAHGKIYPALLALTARLIGRGMGAADAIAALHGLLDQCAWKATDPKTWQSRLDGVEKMVASAVKKFADPRERQAGADGLVRTDKGAIAPCEHNAFQLLAKAQIYDDLHFDEFLSRLRIEDRDWIDADDLICVRWLQAAHKVAGFNLGHARNAARSVAYSRRRDSLREFVEALPKWDGVQRIEMAFTDSWGAPDNALTRASSLNFLVALIARALKPGAKVDTFWCFEAAQGKLKSMSLHALGGDFHAEITAPIGSTDFMRELRGIWIAEMSELDSLRGREASTVKRLLSAPSDRFVEKYQTHTATYPRRAVAVATTNEAVYWQDSTGARRLVPIVCGEIRIDLIEANRLQWLAEARHLYLSGASWWEFPAVIAEAQDERQQIDAWEDTLRDLIANGRRTDSMDGQGREDWPEGWISSAAIMRDWLKLQPHQQGPVSGVRLGRVMRRLGYTPKRHGKDRERGWGADTQDADLGGVSA